MVNKEFFGTAFGACAHSGPLFRARPLTSSLLLLAASGSWAQSPPPDAGSLRQQIEQSRELALPPAVRAPRLAPPPEMAPRAGLSVTVSAFAFAGNTLLGSEQLARAVAGHLPGPLPRALSFEQLQGAANAVATAYRQAGWIVRVYLPEQDLQGGQVLLQIVEARFAGLRQEGPAPRHVLPAELEAYFGARQKTGEPLNADALDRALLLADDLPGAGVVGTLVPGQADGETALVLQTSDEPFASGEVSVDNQGARSTGSQRVGTSLALASPGGRGELLSLNLLNTRGSDYARVALTVPGGHDGLRVGLSASTMSYRVIEGAASVLAADIAGHSSSWGADASYPLIRARPHNLYLALGVESKHFYNDDKNKSAADPKSYSDYDSHSLRVGLSGNLFDELGGGGANSASVQLQWGRLAGMLAHRQIDTLARPYHKVSYSLSRQQTLAAEHALLVSLSGQQATQLLDSSEKFYIGGAGSVRAYPVSELGGESGQVLTGEWRWRVHSAVLVSTFADMGRVRARPATGSDADSTKLLRGYGLGLTWQTPLRVSVKAVWARRHGLNPQPTATGTDGDGTRKLDRYWLSASLPF